MTKFMAKNLATSTTDRRAGIDRLPALVGIVAVLASTGCVQPSDLTPDSRDSGSATSAAATSINSQFADIPMPSGAAINVDKTLVFGSDPWFGQLTLDSRRGPNAMFDFYRDNLPKYQWQEVTSVRAPTSILTFAQTNRVVAVSIRKATLLGTEITITVSPRGMPSEAKPNKDSYIPVPKVLPAPPGRGQ